MQLFAGIIISFLVGFVLGLVFAKYIDPISDDEIDDAIESMTKQAEPAQRHLDREMGVIKKNIEARRGFVYVPPDDDEVAREEFIKENQAKGKDTKLSDLR